MLYRIQNQAVKTNPISTVKKLFSASFKYNFNSGIPYNFTQGQSIPKIQKEYEQVDFEVESPALGEKKLTSGKFAYLKMLETMLDCPNKLIQGNFQINLEAKFESRIIEFRELMESQGTKLSLAIVRKHNGKIAIQEIIEPENIFYEEIEEEIEVIYNGCLKIFGVEADRSMNDVFRDYEMDLTTEGQISYMHKKKGIAEEKLLQIQEQQKQMKEDMKEMGALQKNDTSKTLKVSFNAFPNF